MPTIEKLREEAIREQVENNSYDAVHEEAHQAYTKACERLHITMWTHEACE